MNPQGTALEALDGNLFERPPEDAVLSDTELGESTPPQHQSPWPPITAADEVPDENLFESTPGHDPSQWPPFASSAAVAEKNVFVSTAGQHSSRWSPFASTDVPDENLFESSPGLVAAPTATSEQPNGWEERNEPRVDVGPPSWVRSARLVATRIPRPSPRRLQFLGLPLLVIMCVAAVVSAGLSGHGSPPRPAHKVSRAGPVVAAAAIPPPERTHPPVQAHSRPIIRLSVHPRTARKRAARRNHRRRGRHRVVAPRAPAASSRSPVPSTAASEIAPSGPAPEHAPSSSAPQSVPSVPVQRPAAVPTAAPAPQPPPQAPRQASSDGSAPPHQQEFNFEK